MDIPSWSDSNKQLLIQYVDQKNKTPFQLVFVYKYDHYRPFLSFIPSVLTDIIMSYVEDKFVIKCLLCHIDIHEYITLESIIFVNYEKIKIRTRHYLPNEHGNPFMNTGTGCYYMWCQYNHYMRKYHNYEQYFNIVCNGNCSPNLITQKSNRIMHEAIILKQIHKVLKKHFGYLEPINKQKTSMCIIS